MQLSAEKIWNSAQEHLRSKLSNDTYNMWFAPLRACAIDGNHVTLEAANEFCEVWLKDNYLSLLQDAFAIAAGRQLQVKFKIAPGGAPAPVIPVTASGQSRQNGRTRPRTAGQQRTPFQSQEHLRIVCRRQQQQFRLRRRPGRRPGARQILQPAVSLRRRRPGQDASAARHRPARRRQQERRARRLCFVRKVHQRIH